MIFKEGVLANPTNIEAILQWEPPKAVTKVCSFLGLTIYYKRLIEGFSKISIPLTQLIEKGQTFKWTKKMWGYFQELKRLTTFPILAISNLTKHFVIFCDASKMGLDVFGNVALCDIIGQFF